MSWGKRKTPLMVFCKTIPALPKAATITNDSFMISLNAFFEDFYRKSTLCERYFEIHTRLKPTDSILLKSGILLINSNQTNETNLNSAQFHLTQIDSTQFNSTQLISTQLDLTQLSSTQFGLIQPNLTQLNSTKLN